MVGKKMTIGEDIVLKITGPCTRCVMITLPQGDLPQDLGIPYSSKVQPSNCGSICIGASWGNNSSWRPHPP
ncbi:MAG: hypothetical protein ACJ71M_10890 [Nitrososphaeraceae archaeon]